MYPTPRSVLMSSGAAASTSILRRRRKIWNIDASVENFYIVVHQRLGAEQMFPAQHSFAAIAKVPSRAQNSPLVKGTISPRRRGQATVPQAEHPTGKHVPRPLGVLFWLSHLQFRPPQHRADARQKLTRAEGLSEIVVGAELKSNDAVNLIEMLTGKHDVIGRSDSARRARTISKPFSFPNFRSRITRSTPPAVSTRAISSAIRSRADPDILIDQVIGDHGAQCGIIVNDENVLQS